MRTYGASMTSANSQTRTTSRIERRRVQYQRLKRRHQRRKTDLGGSGSARAESVMKLQAATQGNRKVWRCLKIRPRSARTAAARIKIVRAIIVIIAPPAESPG